MKKNAIYYDQTHHVNCQGKSLLQAAKQHLKGEKWNVGYISALGSAVLCCFGVQSCDVVLVMLCCFGVLSCYVVLLSSHVLLVILCCFGVQSSYVVLVSSHVMLFWTCCFGVQSSYVVLVMLCCFDVQSCYVVLVPLFWCPAMLCCFGHVMLFWCPVMLCFGPAVLVSSHVMLFWCLQWETRNVCSTLVTHLCQWDSLQNLLVQFLILWQLQHMRQQLLQWYVPVQSTVVKHWQTMHQTTMTKG